MEPAETIEVEDTRVSCDGGGGALGKACGRNCRVFSFACAGNVRVGPSGMKYVEAGAVSDAEEGFPRSASTRCASVAAGT